MRTIQVIQIIFVRVWYIVQSGSSRRLILILPPFYGIGVAFIRSHSLSSPGLHAESSARGRTVRPRNLFF